jgi:hypothetical protein
MAKRKYPTVPSHIRITAKRDYEVTYINNFKDPIQLGECRWEPPQIVIKAGQCDKEMFSTVLHEVIHAISFEEDINLTEKQVLKFEKGILRVLKLNGWI